MGSYFDMLEFAGDEALGAEAVAMVAAKVVKPKEPKAKKGPKDKEQPPQEQQQGGCDAEHPGENQPAGEPMLEDLERLHAEEAGQRAGLETQVMNAKEQRRKRDRERYAKMTNEEKEEKLKRRREAYEQNKTFRKTKKYADLEPEKRKKLCTQKRQKYANLQPEQKKARLEQILAYREFRRNTPCKESNAMVNPLYIPTEEEVRRRKRYASIWNK